jgi:predicted Zn-dependent peptidase
MSIDRKAGPTGVPIAQLDFPHTPAKNLGNGINGWLYPTPGTGVARLYVVFPGGARMVPEPWTLSAAAQLQLSGNDLYSAAAIQEKIEALGATVEMHVEPRYHQLCISAQTKHLSEALSIWLEHSSSVIFPQHELDVYLTGLISDLQIRQTTPRYWSHRRLMEALCGPGHYLGLFSETVDLQDISIDKLKNYTRLYLRNIPCFMILCGDVDEGLFSKLGQQWGRVGGGTAMPNWNQRSSADQHLSLTVPNTNQVSLSWGKTGIQIADEQYYDFWVLNTLLGGFFGSRLMKNIREEKGLTYGIHSSLVNHGDQYHWYIQSEIKAGNTDLVNEEIRNELNRLIEEAVSEVALNKVKQYLCGNLKMSFDGPFSMAAKRRDLTLLGRDYLFYDRAIELIHQVHSNRIQALASNFLIPDTFYSSAAGLI